MKKFGVLFSTILITISLIICANMIFTNAAQATGDINQDGKINSSDEALIIRFIFGIINLNDTTLADLNSDGKVNSSDVSILQRYLLGIISSFPSNTTVITTKSSSTNGYNLVWSDEFNDNKLNTSNWVYDIGGNGWGNNELQYYTDSTSNCTVENGMLTITAKKENKDSNNYTSARIKTQGKQEWTYGKIEARIKAPIGQGIWPAFWMLGSNISSVSWPKCGEIDVLEHVNSVPEINGTIHWDLNGHQYYGTTTSADVTQFHTYSVEWDSSSIKWFLDGTKYHEANILDSINGTDEFHKPFFIILNLAVGGSWPGNPDSTTTFPSKMFVDYVRVYQKNSSSSTVLNTSPSTSVSPSSTSSNVSNSIYSIKSQDIPTLSSNAALNISVLNGTNGKYSDNQLYWGVLGINPVNNKWSYLDASGNLQPISQSLNDASGHLTKNGINYANIYHTVADRKWTSLPKITSGRMFLSVGGPCYIKTFDTGFAGPDINNYSDPNKDILFDFVEFTVDNTGYHGNTTRVDAFGFPIQHRLINISGTYDKTVGEFENETRDGIFTKFKNEVPNEFKSLATDQAPYRIVAPMHGSFAVGKENSNYFSSYTNISTQDILLGIGNAANPQACANLNRHVSSTNQNNPNEYYKSAPANYYAKFWHDHSIDNLSYGFCYDDVNQQAAYLETSNPKGLIVRIGW